jgi:hypothetical protein
VNAQQIVEAAGAQWVGIMNQSLVIFRDPLTRSTCAAPLAGLSIRTVLAKLKLKRKEFGL